MRDNHDLWWKRIHISPYLSDDLWRDRDRVMAILSDYTSCKVVDQVRAIGHALSRLRWQGWETAASLIAFSWVYFKLFKARYYTQSFVKRDHLNHTHLKLAVQAGEFMTCMRDKLRPWGGFHHKHDSFYT